MTFKQKTYAQCLDLLNHKIQEMENILKGLKDSAGSSTKSSAGDKHETGRTMIQLEQENTGKQLHEALEQKAQLERTGSGVVSERVMKGSLVKTNKGNIFLSVALGKIPVDENSVMVISPGSPLGKKLLGLEVNGTTSINGVQYIIEHIC